MSNATLAWSLGAVISVWILTSSGISNTTSLFQIEAAAQKQGNSTSVITNNNNTITKANNNNLVNEGISFLIVGKYSEAISLFDKALFVDPSDIKTLINKGNALDSLGNHQEALQYYDKALAIE